MIILSVSANSVVSFSPQESDWEKSKHIYQEKVTSNATGIKWESLLMFTMALSVFTMAALAPDSFKPLNSQSYIHIFAM